MKQKSLYHSRVEALRKATKSQCDGIIIDSPVDLLYLTGLQLSLGRLIVAETVLLLVDGRYIEMCERESPFPVKSSKESLNRILGKTAVKKLGFDSSTPYATYQKLNTTVGKKYNLIPLDAPVLKIRAVKDAGEIALLKDAAALGSEGYDYVLTLLKEGVSEREVAAELQIFWLKAGATGTAFAPIIAFGENTSMPHYRPGDRKLRKGDIVMIDIGVTLNGYHSDMTRTLFFGKVDPRLVSIHQIVCEAQKRALKGCKPGVQAGMVDALARDYIINNGYGDKFNHGLGHGVGLEVHELPVLKNIVPYDKVKLEKGMALTVEPGIYLPGVGGVRIEDTVIITGDGYENITKRPTAGVFR